MKHKFDVGDRVRIDKDYHSHDGEAGEIVELSPSGKFAVVEMESDGTRESFDLFDIALFSEVEDEDTDLELFFAFYEEDEDSYWVGKVFKDEDTGKWEEEDIDEKSPHNWGTQRYMSYLSKNDIASWLEKDYGRRYDIHGPFDSEKAARRFMKQRFYLDEGFFSSVKDTWDALNTVSHAAGPYSFDGLSLATMKKLIDFQKADSLVSKYFPAKKKFHNLLDKEMKTIINKHPEVLTQYARDVIDGKQKLAEAFKPGDTVHIAHAVKGGSGVFGKLDRIDGEFAYVKSFVDGREKTFKGQAKLLSRANPEKLKEQVKSTFNVGDRVIGPLGKGTIVKLIVSAKEAEEDLLMVKLDDPSKAGEDGKTKDTFRMTSYHLKHLKESNDDDQDLLEKWVEIEQKYGFEEGLKIFEQAKNRRSINEGKFLQDMLKNVTTKRNFKNTNTKIDDAAIKGAEKTSKGKNPFDGIDYGNDVPLMKQLLDRAKATKMKEVKVTKDIQKSAEVGSQKDSAQKHLTMLKDYADYLSKGKSIPGGKINAKGSGVSFSEEDGEGVGESVGHEFQDSMSMQDAFKKFHHFLDHIAQEEMPACKLVKMSVCKEQNNCIDVHVECRDIPREEGLQKDLAEKLEARLDKHPLPGLLNVKFRVFNKPHKPNKIAR